MKKIYFLILILFGMHLGSTAQTLSFFYTGSVQTWVVPSGIDTIQVIAKGAEGGLNAVEMTTSCTFTPAGTLPDRQGYGACVKALLAVTPGQVLNIFVGQKGADAVDVACAGTLGVGGWNGGGDGGFGYGPYAGGGGGGASDIRIGGVTFADRVIVAAGGGGAGGNYYDSVDFERGGDGGTLTGEDGYGFHLPFSNGGAQGGGPGSGGAPGTYAGWASGIAGVLGIGGNAGTGPAFSGSGGGGGGGGYYGGGGGSWGGGGGGSSYASTALTANVTHTRGCNNTGDGEVDICILDPGKILGAVPFCAGQSITLTETIGGGTWSSSSTSIATVGSSTGKVTGVSGGLVYITYTLASACAKVYTVVNLRVIAAPKPIIYTNPLCVGATATMFDATPGGFWTSSDTTKATIGYSTGVVNGIYPGNPTISYTNPTAGCYVTFSLDVDGIAGVTKVCDGNTITLVSSTGGGVWTSSASTIASVGTSGVVTGLSMGTSTISYSSPVCPSSVVVTVNPVAPIVAPDSICASGTTYFTNVVGGGAWSTSDAKVATVTSGPGLVSGIKAGTAIISYMLPTGCLSLHATTVIALPPAIMGTMHLCPGKTTALTDTLAGGVWTSSNTTVTTINASGVVTGINADTSYIYYTIKPGCSVNAMVIVNPLPFPITGIDTICPGVTDTLKDASIGGLWSTTTPLLDTIVDTTGKFTTKFITGSSYSNAIVNYTLPTGCVRSKTIYIYPTPKPLITYNWALNTFYTTPGFPGYQWYDSVTGLIPHATSPNLAMIYYEWYYVVVTDTNGCKAKSDLYYRESTSLGANSLNVADIKIYPNPSTGILYITSPVKVRAVLSGIDGKIEMTVADAKELDISRLADAAYFISLYDESGQLVTVRKIVKE